MNICRRLGVTATIVLTGTSVAVSQAPRTNALSFKEAINRALTESPRLKAAAARIEFATGQVQQARLVPNPAFEWSGEEITGDRRGFGETEHTFALSQLIELGGKRSARIRHAQSGAGVAAIELESRQADVRANVTSLFIETAMAQRKLGLMSESIRLAGKLRSSAEERVMAGAAPEVETIRADVALSNVRLDSVIAHSGWMNAKTALAATWGANEPDFDSVSTALPEVTPPPGLPSLLAALNENPDLRQWEAELQRARSGLRAVRSLGMPDLTISAGPRYLASDNSHTFILGLSVPLPLFNRHQGDAASARSAVRDTEWQRIAANVNARSALSAAHTSMQTAFGAVATMRDVIIPAAESAAEEMQRGFRDGRFTYLDVLSSQQDLMHARVRYIETLSNYYQRRIDVERLIGSPIAATGGDDD